MKSMTCIQLGGACDKVFSADTFAEIAAMSKQHGMEMYKAQDAAHIEAMSKMQKRMQSTTAMQEWFAEIKKTFDALAED